MVVVEDAADAARFAAMGQPEIVVRPFFVARICARRMSFAGVVIRLVKDLRVGSGFAALIGLRRIEIAAAAEPPLRRADVARVHVRGGAVRVAHVRDQRNAGGPKARVVGGAGNVLGEVGRKRAMHGADVNAHFLEEAPAHHPSDAAALIGGSIAAPPRRADKASRLPRIEAGRRFILQRLERGANLVAQAFKPGAGLPLWRASMREGSDVMEVACLPHRFGQGDPPGHDDVERASARLHGNADAGLCRAVKFRRRTGALLAQDESVARREGKAVQHP